MKALLVLLLIAFSFGERESVLLTENYKKLTLLTRK